MPNFWPARGLKISAAGWRSERTSRCVQRSRWSTPCGADDMRALLLPPPKRDASQFQELTAERTLRTAPVTSANVPQPSTRLSASVAQRRTRQATVVCAGSEMKSRMIGNSIAVQYLHADKQLHNRHPGDQRHQRADGATSALIQARRTSARERKSKLRLCEARSLADQSRRSPAAARRRQSGWRQAGRRRREPPPHLRRPVGAPVRAS